MHCLCDLSSVGDSAVDLFSATNVIPLLKKDDGLRPLVAGEVLRSIIFEYMLSQTEILYLKYFTESSAWFFKHTTWCSIAVFVVRACACELTDRCILKTDIRNAFNTISRVSCCAGIESVDPALSTWVQWCLRNPLLLACGGNSLQCCIGVQQGEPMSPMLFSAGLSDLVRKIHAKCPLLFQLWYLDDGIFTGPPKNSLKCLN